MRGSARAQSFKAFDAVGVAAYTAVDTDTPAAEGVCMINLTLRKERLASQSL